MKLNKLVNPSIGIYKHKSPAQLKAMIKKIETIGCRTAKLEKKLLTSLKNELYLQMLLKK